MEEFRKNGSWLKLRSLGMQDGKRTRGLGRTGPSTQSRLGTGSQPGVCRHKKLGKAGFWRASKGETMERLQSKEKRRNGGRHWRLILRELVEKMS